MASRVLQVVITGDAKSAVTAFGEAGAASDGFGSKLAGVGKSVAAVGAGMGLAFAAIAVKSADKFSEIGKQVLTLNRYMGDTPEQASRMRTAFELSGIDIDKASKALGIFSKNIATGKLDGIKTDFTGGAVAAAGLEKATAKLNTEQQKLHDLQDRLHGKAKLTVSDLQQLRDAQDKVAAAQAGVNKLQEGGINAADKYGIAIRDSAGKLLPMHEILLRVADKFKSMPDGVDKTAMAMQMFGKSGAEMIRFLDRGRAGITELEKQSDKYGLTLTGDNLNAIKKSTAAHRALGAAWEGLQVQIGAHVMPVITGVTKFMATEIPKATALVQAGFDRLHPAFVWLQEAFVWVQRGIGVLVEGFQTAGNGPQLSGFAGAIQRVGNVARTLVDDIVAAWPRIRDTAITVFGAVQTAVSSAASFVSDNFPKVQAVVAAVMDGVRTAIAGVSGFIKDNWPAIKSTAETVFGAVQTAVGNVVGFFKTTLIPGIKAVVDWVKQNWTQISTTFKNVFTIVKDVVIINWAIIAGIIYAGIKAVQFIWDNFGKTIVQVLKDAWNLVSGIVKGAMEVIQGIIKTVTALIHGDWGQAWNGIKQILAGVWDAIKAIVQGAINAVKDVISLGLDAVKEVFGTAWDAVKSVVSGVWNWMKSTTSDEMNAVSSTISNVWDGIVNFFTSIPNKIGGALSGLVDAIGAPFKAAWNFIANTWNNTIGKLSFKIPDWVPGVGGDGFSMPTLPTLHTGGVYRAPAGRDEGLALLQDGERVLSRPQTAAYDSGYKSPRTATHQHGDTIVVNVGTALSSKREIADAVESALRHKTTITGRQYLATT